MIWEMGTRVVIYETHCIPSTLEHLSFLTPTAYSFEVDLAKVHVQLTTSSENLSRAYSNLPRRSGLGPIVFFYSATPSSH